MVSDLNRARSSGRCQGSSPPRPITPLLATAAITDTLTATAASRPSHRDRGLDVWVRVVAHEREVLEHELVELAARGLDLHPRQRPRLALELHPRLLEVVEVQVRVA